MLDERLKDQALKIETMNQDMESKIAEKVEEKLKQIQKAQAEEKEDMSKTIEAMRHDILRRALEPEPR